MGDALCSVGHAGELFTSAAPQDPLFWALHGLSERFLQYARLLKGAGTISFTEKWGYESVSTASNTHIVCDWSEVNQSSMQLPTCTRESCEGHRANDLLPWDFEGRSFTNIEFYELTAPHNVANMPYAYDSLSHWAGCTDSKLVGVQ